MADFFFHICIRNENKAAAARKNVQKNKKGGSRSEEINEEVMVYWKCSNGERGKWRKREEEKPA